MLHNPGSLRDEDNFRLIPTTIVSAIGFTSAIGERYLWVDALCIVQDDNFQRKQEQLNSMTAIYANASLVIVVADGAHSDHGLRGIREVPRAIKRNLHQTIVPFGRHRQMVKPVFNPSGGINLDDPFNIYHQRAWTFQEYLFSRRRVVFGRNSIFWECGSTIWREDLLYHDDEKCLNKMSLAAHQAILASALPSTFELLRLIDHFNRRKLTYEGDCIFAFAGIASALSMTSHGGFVSGLPEMFLDAALLWQPCMELRRRVDDRGDHFYLPSWSWVGWAGGLDLWSWQSGCDFLKERALGLGTTRETFPVTKWQVIEGHASATSLKHRREMSQTRHKFKERYRRVEHPLPDLEEGWTRHGIPKETWDGDPPPEGFGVFFYNHISCPDKQFWYPVPLRQRGANLIVRQPAYYLCGFLETAVLYKGEPMKLDRFVNIEDKSGQWAGVLHAHRHCDLLENSPRTGQAMELVAISKGIAQNSSRVEFSMAEWNSDKRPKDGRLYEFYNVLWISRSGGFAYRQGIGRIHKDIWDRQDRKKEEVILA